MTGSFDEEKLPDYSAERYYSLSQIQAQDADLVFTEMSSAEAAVEGYADTFRSRLKEDCDEDGAGENEHPEIGNRGHFGDAASRVSVLVAYVLVVLKENFDEGREVAKLIERVSALAAHPAVTSSCGPDAVFKYADTTRIKSFSGDICQSQESDNVVDLSRVLQVDVLAPSSGISFCQAKAFARAALRGLDAMYLFSKTGKALRQINETGSKRRKRPALFIGRAISVSDRVEACPGIERMASHLAECLPPGALRVVARNRDELMGTVQDSEPDAVQGVSQWTVGDLHLYQLQPLQKVGIKPPIAMRQSDGQNRTNERSKRNNGNIKFWRRLGGAGINAAMAVVFISALLQQIPGGWKFFNGAVVAASDFATAVMAKPLVDK